MFGDELMSRYSLSIGDVLHDQCLAPFTIPFYGEFLIQVGLIWSLECNMGIASWIGQISEENSVLVDILLDAGAM